MHMYMHMYMCMYMHMYMHMYMVLCVHVMRVKGRNRTVINIYRVTTAPSHRRHARLLSTRARQDLRSVVLDESPSKTAHSCDSCHTQSAHA